MKALLREFPAQSFYKTVIALTCSKFSKYFQFLTLVMCNITAQKNITYQK